MARSLRHWAGDFWCENLPNTSVLQNVPETWRIGGVLHNFQVSLRKVFFPLGMFMMFSLGQKKSFQQNHGWFAEFFSGHVDADYPKVGDHLHHFW